MSSLPADAMLPATQPALSTFLHMILWDQRVSGTQPTFALLSCTSQTEQPSRKCSNWHSVYHHGYCLPHTQHHLAVPMSESCRQDQDAEHELQTLECARMPTTELMLRMRPLRRLPQQGDECLGGGQRAKDIHIIHIPGGRQSQPHLQHCPGSASAAGQHCRYCSGCV